ncbi:hypothetical protein DFH27DRAFT_570408 [Peziza echinospora]|nr:hypothetical protein DFH27DRAFT_570408 [Peziza echinospora]
MSSFEAHVVSSCVDGPPCAGSKGSIVISLNGEHAWNRGSRYPKAYALGIYQGIALPHVPVGLCLSLSLLLLSLFFLAVLAFNCSIFCTRLFFIFFIFLVSFFFTILILIHFPLIRKSSSYCARPPHHDPDNEPEPPDPDPDFRCSPGL